jgi:hypothetical protein
MASTPERMQLAGEIIRFFEERIPPERRARFAWVVCIEDKDDPGGRQMVSVFSDPKITSMFLAWFVGAAARPGEESIPTTAAPEAS